MFVRLEALPSLPHTSVSSKDEIRGKAVLTFVHSLYSQRRYCRRSEVYHPTSRSPVGRCDARIATLEKCRVGGPLVLFSGAAILELSAAASFPIVCHYNGPSLHVALAQIQSYAYTLARSWFCLQCLDVQIGHCDRAT